MHSIWTSLKFCCLVKGKTISNLSSANAVSLDQAKFLSFRKELTSFEINVW